MQSYGSKWLDGSLLLIPTTGFLPPDDPRILGTIRAVERRLLQDGFVMRHDPAEVETGLAHGEGAFLACSFWLVDAMVMTGRAEEGQRLFDRLLALRNDLGLLSEEYDVGAQRLVGNFPQAFSHVALVNSAYNLARSSKPAEQRCGRGGGRGLARDPPTTAGIDHPANRAPRRFRTEQFIISTWSPALSVSAINGSASAGVSRVRHRRAHIQTFATR